MDILHQIEREGLRTDLPQVRPGDTVKVYSRLKEADREHLQLFEGVVIRLSGAAIRQNLTVRKVSYGVGVERIFPLHSPFLAKLELVSRGRVRRSKLYYLRKLTGKKARLDEVEANESSVEPSKIATLPGPAVTAHEPPRKAAAL